MALSFFFVAKKDGKLRLCQDYCYLNKHTIVKNMQSRSGVTQSGVEILQSGKELTTKVGEQPWPQLVHCASICCRICGCVFQEDRIVVRSSGEE